MAIDFAQGIVALVMVVFVAGCTTTGEASSLAKHDNWGEANRQTMAAQIINPNPVYDGPLMTSGGQVAAALERYRTGQVKQPERQKTSKIATSGGSN